MRVEKRELLLTIGIGMIFLGLSLSVLIGIEAMISGMSPNLIGPTFETLAVGIIGLCIASVVEEESKLEYVLAMPTIPRGTCFEQL